MSSYSYPSQEAKKPQTTKVAAKQRISTMPLAEPQFSSNGLKDVEHEHSNATATTTRQTTTLVGPGIRISDFSVEEPQLSSHTLQHVHVVEEESSATSEQQQQQQQQELGELGELGEYPRPTTRVAPGRRISNFAVTEPGTSSHSLGVTEEESINSANDSTNKGNKNSRISVMPMDEPQRMASLGKHSDDRKAAPRLSGIVAPDMADVIRQTTRGDLELKEREARMAAAVRNMAMQQGPPPPVLGTSNHDSMPAPPPLIADSAIHEKDKYRMSAPAMQGPPPVLATASNTNTGQSRQSSDASSYPSQHGKGGRPRNSGPSMQGPPPVLATASNTNTGQSRQSDASSYPSQHGKGGRPRNSGPSMQGPPPVLATASTSGSVLPGPPPLMADSAIHGKETYRTSGAQQSSDNATVTGVSVGSSEASVSENTVRTSKSAPPPGQREVVGAVGVYASGMVVQHRPAALANQPRGMSTAELAVPTSTRPSTGSYGQPPPTTSRAPVPPPNIPQSPPEDVDYSKRTVPESFDDKTADQPFYKKRKFMIIAAVVVVLIIAIGAGVAAAGGGDEGDPKPNSPAATPKPTMAPAATPKPTMAPTATPEDPTSTESWDIQRRDVSKFHIVESFQLTDQTTLEDFRTAQFNAWKWLVTEDQWSVITSPAEEMDPDEVRMMMNRYVLAVTFFELNGPEWAYQATTGDDFVEWLQSDRSHCDWTFIGCDQASIDVTILFSGGRPGGNILGGAANMRGELPQEIRFFTGLTSLRMPGNLIYNVDALTPDVFVDLTVLDLAGNPLDDAAAIFRLPNIQTLSLQQCGISGPLPEDLRGMTNLGKSQRRRSMMESIPSLSKSPYQNSHHSLLHLSL
jgi:hypothetical protein